MACISRVLKNQQGSAKRREEEAAAMILNHRFLRQGGD